MAEGGSFLNPRVGEPNRRAFLDLDRRVSQLAEDLTAGDVSFAGDVEVDGTLTANHIHGNLAGAVYLHVKNTSGVTIPAGSPVYATGSVGASGATEVARSECDVASTMPALGVLQEALGNNGEGHATVLGVAGGLDTSAWSVNDSLYVSASGTLTNVRPTGASELVQKIGRVIRVNASTGEVLVLGAGRTNDIPNDIPYLPLSGGTVSGATTFLSQVTFSATDGVKITGSSGGIWFDDRNGDGSKWVMYHDGNILGMWNGSTTPWLVTDSGTVQIESGDSSYTRYGPNVTWGGYLYVGATPDKAGSSAAAVISTNGNLHLDAGDSRDMFLNYYTQGRPIEIYGPVDTNGYDINMGPSLHFGQHTLYSPYQYRSVLIPDSYPSYGVSFGEYYARPTVASYTTSQPLYLVGGGNVQIGVHSNNRIGYFDTNGLYLEQGWLRTYNQTGWYNQTYGGGIRMEDSTWIRTYGSKRYYSDMETAGYTIAAHGGLVIGGAYDKSAFNSTYARRHSIQIEVDTYWGGYHDSHTGALIWCGQMNAGAWGTAELGFRTSNYWGSYHSANPFRMKGTRGYLNLGIETALNVHTDGGGRLGYYSSRRELKNLVEEIPPEKSLARIMKLQPIDFTWKAEYRPNSDNTDLIDFDVHRGFYAEDAAAVDRSYGAWGWLYRGEDGNDDEDFTGEPLTESLLNTTQQLEDAVVVSYNDKAILADLVGSVQALNARIMELEALSGVA